MKITREDPHPQASRTSPSIRAVTLWGLGLALLLAVPVLLACSQGPALHGWPITPTPAADFALTSQSGEKVRLSDYRGDLTVVTFMYTNCTTACPLISLGLKMAQDKLTPDEARRVHFLSVSVDPERDTPESANKLLEVRPHPQGLLFLTGSRPELEAVWRAYKVETRQVMYTPTPPPMEGSHMEGGPMPTAIPMEGTSMEGDHDGHVGYIVEHTVLAYLIDKKGMVRSAYVIDAAFTPADMVKDMRALLAAK